VPATPTSLGLANIDRVWCDFVFFSRLPIGRLDAAVDKQCITVKSVTIVGVCPHFFLKLSEKYLPILFELKQLLGRHKWVVVPNFLQFNLLDLFEAALVIVVCLPFLSSAMPQASIWEFHQLSCDYACRSPLETATACPSPVL
jgi:hypothetical protein